MGFFGRFFRKTAAAPGDLQAQRVVDKGPASSNSADAPPDLAEMIVLQRAYWSCNSDEMSELESKGVESLTWPQRLRFHHLVCLQRLRPELESPAIEEKCKQNAMRLLASDSPYRPRPALIWQMQHNGPARQNSGEREPDLNGILSNPSLTHFGCFEILRLDSSNQVRSLEFVSFDELTDVSFAGSSLVRPAKLFYEGGRDELVLLPAVRAKLDNR